ncbi:hypothetical protein ACVGVM_10385 [Pseudonocardia bannensis]|uniref:Phasin domain-containing protein n=1 Tax=Pseudonocardia bannensis TaxID=630973 RepID=A0A848DHA8_9PSEU|nr:hypothetical protein [Pseudonocardia bannensis]NMH92068.1 hypothetical protein [Pseudonocardia bannensis]
MTTSSNQFADIAKRSQEALTTAARTWAETLQGFASSVTGGQRSVPDAHAVVDKTFNFLEQMLENQRQLMHTLVSSGAQATEAVTEQAARAAESGTARTARAAETVADKAAQASEEAGAKASSTARSARDATKS